MNDLEAFQLCEMSRFILQLLTNEMLPAKLHTSKFRLLFSMPWKRDVSVFDFRWHISQKLQNFIYILLMK